MQTASSVPIDKRLQIDTLVNQYEPAEGGDVVAGLTQTPKALPPKYLYDQRGSELFEQICELPEYYPTRAEAAILQQYGEAIAHITGPCELVELGSGSSTKTRYLFNAYQQAQLPLRYLPIDVSGTMLRASAEQLLAEYADIAIHALVSTYEPALTQLPPPQLPRRMVLFLGSTLGNLTPAECDIFLSKVSYALQPGDYFLLGIDLHKDTEILNAAYNDQAGITAAFNRNLLSHLNWRFGGDFDPDQFAHVAFYNELERQIEIYLESQTAQAVMLKRLDLSITFEPKERLLSEISRKFELAAIAQQLRAHRLSVAQTFTDDRQWFGLILCQRLGAG